MKSSVAYGLCVFLLLAARTDAAAADKVIIGINVMGVDQIGDAQQEALAQQRYHPRVHSFQSAEMRATNITLLWLYPICRWIPSE